MSVISWGKPKIEFTKLTGGAKAPTAQAVWTAMPEIKSGTTKLSTAKGNKKEAIQEGGGVVDVKYEKNKYTLEFELFAKKGDKKPIQDEDGLILDNYAVRMTPEDPACPGFIFEFASVSIEENYSTEDGLLWKYMFEGLSPTAGAIMKECVNGKVVEATAGATK